MKMTVTLDTKDIEEIVKEYVARKFNRYASDIENFRINIENRYSGDPRDQSGYPAVKSISMDVKPPNRDVEYEGR